MDTILISLISLGPLLFLICINDLERNIKSNIKCFAEDTMFFSIVNNPAISANEPNQVLNIIYQRNNPDSSKQANKKE